MFFFLLLYFTASAAPSSRTCSSAPVSNVSNPTRDRHRPRPPRSPIRFYFCFVLATTGARVRRPRLPRSSFQIFPIFLFVRDRERLATFTIVPDTSLPKYTVGSAQSERKYARARRRRVLLPFRRRHRRSSTRVRAANFPSDDRMYAHTQSLLASSEAVWLPRFLRFVACPHRPCRASHETRTTSEMFRFSHMTLRTTKVFLPSRRGQLTFNLFIIFSLFRRLLI